MVSKTQYKKVKYPLPADTIRTRGVRSISCSCDVHCIIQVVQYLHVHLLSLHVSFRFINYSYPHYHEYMLINANNI